MIKVIELFGGIGACTEALKRLNIDYEIVDYVEIDKYAVASYNAINGTHFETQDIRNWNKDIDVDLIMHGSPCQDISLAGQQAGADEGSGTRSSLMYETIRIVNKLKPKYVIWENVKNLISKKHKHNFDRYLQALSEGGYTNYWQVLNAKDYGIPQNRERVFTISIRNDIDKDFEFPQKQELKLRLKDLLEDEVDKKYYISDKMKITLLADSGNWQISEKKYEINRQITRAINTREGCYRPDMSEYICDELPNNFNILGLQNVKQIGFIEKGTGQHQSNTIYDSNKLCPTICSAEAVKSPLKFLIKNNTKKGYLEAEVGDGINISSRMKWQRGNVQKQMIQTLDTEGNDRGVVLKDYKIRKLTPKECWRLMGFTDEAFEKASQVNSNTQLYKQARKLNSCKRVSRNIKELIEVR